MNRDVILQQIVMELTSNDYLCDLYNDLVQMQRECGPDDYIPTIDLLVMKAAQDRANELGYHFSDEELRFWFSNEVAVSESYCSEDYSIEEDELPF